MDFGIRRLHAKQESGRRYHLFDGKGKLLLVADHASPWQSADEQNRVQFSRSGGQLVASLDLPVGVGRVRNGRSRTSFALILDHAVYAILNKYQDEDNSKPPFFTIEADGITWLVWHQSDNVSLLTVYNKAPFNLMAVNDPLESAQLDPIGAVNQGIGEYHFTVTLSVNPLHHIDLITLALVFLVDQA